MSIWLKTERLIIKTSSMNNIENVYHLFSDPEVMYYVGTGVKTLEETRERIEKAIQHQTAYGFSIGDVYERNSDLYVGRAGLIHLNMDDTQPEIELGYVLHKKFWQKGYATELVKALIQWGFTHLPLTKLVALVHLENEKSQRVLEKVGMHYAGLNKAYGIETLKYEILKEKNETTYP
jgi:ribosomal-protein-alanine N-acetyltransferase